jgi:hypothetical protein
MLCASSLREGLSAYQDLWPTKRRVARNPPAGRIENADREVSLLKAKTVGGTSARAQPTLLIRERCSADVRSGSNSEILRMSNFCPLYLKTGHAAQRSGVST